jgi:hypothetical protein
MARKPGCHPSQYLPDLFTILETLTVISTNNASIIELDFIHSVVSYNGSNNLKSTKSGRSDRQCALAFPHPLDSRATKQFEPFAQPTPPARTIDHRPSTIDHRPSTIDT